MSTFRKKPVEIQAMQLRPSNIDAIIEWIGDNDPTVYVWENGDGTLTISTLEGDMRADFDDWVIRGVKGEHYPCKPDIFDATYDAVESS